MLRHVLAIGVLVLGAAPAFAQEEPAAVFRTDTRLVVLHATVLDAQGNLVTDLPRSAFRVLENGVEQEIKVFRREDAPVSIGLVIDDSGSMINKRQKVATAGLAFIRASHPENEVFVLHFNERTFLDTDFTGDTQRLERGLLSFDSRGTTAMREALRLSIAHLERRGSEDKKALLIVTDGEDNTSSISRDYVVKAAQQAGVIVYAIGLLHEEDDAKAQAARRELEALARATGGQAFFLNALDEIDRTVTAIARDIRNQYTIAYSPSNQDLDGTFRKVDVEVMAPRPVVVRTRTGYWAGASNAARKASE